MRQPSIWKGAVAGFVGGLAASWAMGEVHKQVSKVLGGENSQNQSEDPTVKVARALARPILHRDLNASEKKIAGPVVHFAFGSSVAAAYGLAAEFTPEVTTGKGMAFGSAVWLGAHVTALPALGLAPPITESKPASEVAEFVAHLLYGGLTELIRSRLRSFSRG
jgi:putative membrane protein